MEKPGRNDPCSCGSGKKYKKCCEMKQSKRSIGSAQILTGTQKMSSLFNRQVKPITPVVVESEPVREEKSEEV